MTAPCGAAKMKCLACKCDKWACSRARFASNPGTTKNGEGREVVMTPEVEELLRAAVANKKPKDSMFTR